MTSRALVVLVTGAAHEGNNGGTFVAGLMSMTSVNCSEANEES
jgi:hypothetical protein